DGGGGWPGGWIRIATASQVPPFESPSSSVRPCASPTPFDLAPFHRSASRVDPRLHPLVADAPSVWHLRPPAERALLFGVEPGEQRLAICSAGRRSGCCPRCPPLGPN